MRKTLLNKYEALNKEGSVFSDKVYKVLDPLVEEMKDYNMFEINSIITGCSDYLTSVIRIKKGMEKRIQERENEKILV